METVTIDEIRRDPLRYLDRVEAGAALLILRDDRPIAEFKPIGPAARPPRPFGLCQGQFRVPDDFDDPLPDEVLDAFDGR